MPKQPYIPLYTGDYLKDTRMLPLSVRGAWVDLMIFMWESKERGVLVYTMPEYAMMMSCSLDDANFAISLLHEKGICDFEIVASGMVKLISRRMVRDALLSKARSEAGSVGGKSRTSSKSPSKSVSKTPSKTQANSDIEYDNDNKVLEPHKIVSRGALYNEDDFYQTPEQAFNEIKENEVMVTDLLRIARREGYVTYNELTVVSAVRSFITTEGAKPDFRNRPRDDLKKHLVNWIRSKAKTLNQYAGT